MFYIDAVADTCSPRMTGRSRLRLCFRALVLVVRFTIKTKWNGVVRRLRVLGSPLAPNHGQGY